VETKSGIVYRYPQISGVDDWRAAIHAWQDRVRNPSLTVLLVLQLVLVFVAAPLAATGLPIAHALTQWLLLAVLAGVVALSRRIGAIVIIVLGLAAMLAGLAAGSEWSAVVVSVLDRGGIILTFSSLTWVVAHAVYAPGRITFHRLRGAVVMYQIAATIFAGAFALYRS
jgi:hypothetical protein